MFNLLISNGIESWNSGNYTFPKSRVVVEYTADEVSERFKALDPQAIAELKSFPTLFAIEDEEASTRIGWITDLRIRQNNVFVQFQFDPALPVLPSGALERLRKEFDLGTWELNRTHWAVKDEPLFEVLLRAEYITQEQLNASAFLNRNDPAPRRPENGEANGYNNTQVFVVHGHDEIAKLEASQFISDLGLEPIVLHMQPSGGRTIIEKIEHYSNVGFGIILYTPCDIGHKVGALTGAYRARQNVVFEHGFLIGKLGRPRVAALVKGEIETPNDISGVVYIPLDTSDGWKETVTGELRAAGYAV